MLRREMQGPCIPFCEHYPDGILGEGNILTRKVSDEAESRDGTELPKRSSQIFESAATE